MDAKAGVPKFGRSKIKRVKAGPIESSEHLSTNPFEPAAQAVGERVVVDEAAAVAPERRQSCPGRRPQTPPR